MRLNALRGRYSGQTCYIVGRGPSLLERVASDFGPGPVITLNPAVLHVRTLSLPNPILTMQKDGCVTHTAAAHTPAEPGHACTYPMVQPVEPETLLVAIKESVNCWADYENRVVMDPEEDFGVPWWTPSAPVAVHLAHAMGCAELVMYGHDGFTRGDARVWERDGVTDHQEPAYAHIGRLADQAARELGMPISWY